VYFDRYSNLLLSSESFDSYPSLSMTTPNFSMTIELLRLDVLAMKTIVIGLMVGLHSIDSMIDYCPIVVADPFAMDDSDTMVYSVVDMG